MNRCKYCGGTFKLIVREYTIRSRSEKNPETTIENLAMNECIICGHLEIPESSEKYIEVIRSQIRREMETKNIRRNLNSLTSERKVGNFVEFIKKLIG